MSKKSYLVVFIMLISIAVKAQMKSSFGFFTDRSMYASGETLLAKVFTPTTNNSRIVHLDLINRSGTRITSVSLEIKNNQADGFLLLPDSLSSGTYLVRAYLKNTAAQQKIIREIWISNRFDGLAKINQLEQVENLSPLTGQETSRIRLDGLQTKYKPGENLSIKVGMDEDLRNAIDGPLMISIAKDNPSFVSKAFLSGVNNVQPDLTEDKGIIISGTVTDKKTLAPASGVTVYLTIPDSVPGFQYYQTRNDGRFYFLISNYYGQVQAVIQCFDDNPARRLKIKLDDDDDAKGELPVFGSIPISEEFKANSSQNIEAITLSKIFDQAKLKHLPAPMREADPYPYYGKLSHIVDPQLFIDLPDFIEISRELLPGVKFRNYNNEPTLQVLNIGMRSYFAEQPLLLMDGIPIRDLNVIRPMGTADIDRIEICQSERFYGNLRFPGVVAIYTTKADYTRIPESDQLIRLNLQTIQPPVILEEFEATETTIPDIRQVIYWNAGVEPSADFTINCRTSSITGAYKLSVRGRLKDGTFFFTEKQLEVQK